MYCHVSLGATALAFCVNRLCSSSASLCERPATENWRTTMVLMRAAMYKGLLIAHNAGSGLEVVSRFCLHTLRDRFMDLSVAISVSICVFVTVGSAGVPCTEALSSLQRIQVRLLDLVPLLLVTPPLSCLVSCQSLQLSYQSSQKNT